MRLTDSSRVTYGSQITPRIWEDSNGQLIIRDAILARCGSYDYLESEIIPNGDKHKIVKVYRTPEEVFNPASIASFENKPFCNDHPKEDVCPLNYKDLHCGFIRDIRRGTGELNECLIGDVIVTDPYVISLIKSGDKRELSLGYNTQIVLGDDGKYYMTRIRGNHLALVDDGRAGIATIRDKNSIKNIKGEDKMAKKILFKAKDKNAFINKLYDEDIVEVEELEDDEDVVINEVPENGECNGCENCEKPTEEVHDDDTSDDFKAIVISKLDEILGLLKNNGGVQDAELPVEKTVEVAKEQKVDEDIKADEVEGADEPKLFDAEADKEETTVEEVKEEINNETEDEDEDDETGLTDSASNLYKGLVNVGDSKAGNNLAEEINQSFVDRYKKFGGKN